MVEQRAVNAVFERSSVTCLDCQRFGHFEKPVFHGLTRQLVRDLGKWNTGFARVWGRMNCLPSLPAQFLTYYTRNTELRDLNSGGIVLDTAQRCFPILYRRWWWGHVSQIKLTVVRHRGVHGGDIDDKLGLREFLLWRGRR